MRQLIWTSVSFCLVLSGCQESQQVAGPATKPIPAAGPSIAIDAPAELTPAVRSDELSIGEALQFANLAVFPVLSNLAKSEDRFLTLDEGLKDGTVEVCEVGTRPRSRAASGANEGEPTADRQPIEVEEREADFHELDDDDLSAMHGRRRRGREPPAGPQ